MIGMQSQYSLVGRSIRSVVVALPGNRTRDNQSYALIAEIWISIAVATCSGKICINGDKVESSGKGWERKVQARKGEACETHTKEDSGFFCGLKKAG